MQEITSPVLFLKVSSSLLENKKRWFHFTNKVTNVVLRITDPFPKPVHPTKYNVSFTSILIIF